MQDLPAGGQTLCEHRSVQFTMRWGRSFHLEHEYNSILYHQKTKVECIRSVQKSFESEQYNHLARIHTLKMFFVRVAQGLVKAQGVSSFSQCAYSLEKEFSPRSHAMFRTRNQLKRRREVSETSCSQKKTQDTFLLTIFGIL